MGQIRLKGFQTGENIGAVGATVGAGSDSASIFSFQLPSPQTTLPTISDAFASGTLTPDNNGITVTTRIWRNADTQASLGSGATLSGAGLGGEWIEYSPDNGATWSPPVRVYENGMMSSHDADDAAVMTIVPHADMTHIAVQNGDWTSANTWLGRRVPRFGSVVLIPKGIAVKYDEVGPNIRLDRIRIDGRLWVDTTNLANEQLKMLVETVVVTREGDFEVGTAANRMPDTADFTLTISGKDYSATSYLPTNMKASRFSSARGWERGVLAMGRWSFWGAEKTTWFKAEPIAISATSLTARQDVAGLSVGDTIVIGGTDCNWNGVDTPIWFDEERQITAISGRTVSWSDPLTRAHDNTLASSTRTDLYPLIMVRGNKNITFRSEVTDDNAKRGHTAWMHRFSVVDGWDAQFIAMGRTDKQIKSGTINGSGDFIVCADDGGPVDASTLVNTDNLQSRYPVHLHHVGFDHAGARPIVDNCYVEDSPGWAMVHHSCDADFQGCGMYKFTGAGLVSESGNEVGGWINCAAMHSKHTDDNLDRSPKIIEGTQARGDTFRRGHGFAYRGRAMRVVGCVACSVYCGHCFHHREAGDASTQIVAYTKLRRDQVDLKRAGALRNTDDYKDGLWNVPDYPIIHFADCESIGTFWGFFVTKLSPSHDHDINIRLKRFKSWGFRYNGAELEYVGAYLMDRWDVIAGGGRSAFSIGISLGQNAHQMILRSPRIEGGRYGFLTIGTTNASNQDHDTDNPRWGLHSAEFLNAATSDQNIGTGDPYVATLYEEDDFTDTLIDYDADPTENLPLALGEIDGAGDYSSLAGNGAGRKSDNISTQAKLLSKEWDRPFRANEFFLKRSARIDGFWQYGGKDVYVIKDIISDRLTARPFKMTKVYEAPLGSFFNEAESIDNGAWSYGATPVSAANLTAVIAKNGSVTIDVPAASSPSGGDGSAYALDTDDHIAPDRGKVTLDGGTGQLTFTPDRDFTGTDEMYVFVESGNRYGTVRINFLVTEDGTDAGLATPAVGTHFSASDGGSQKIDLELGDPPSAGGRRIDLVQYSTDGGVTWRRLCNGWVKAAHEVSLGSDNTIITAGSYTVRIRYRVDYDFIDSTASGDDVVAVG